MKLTISISEDETKVLRKRANKNYLTLIEQIEDIIRRSCISSQRASKLKQIKIDDKLVAIFSRERRGRKPLKKKTKKKKWLFLFKRIFNNKFYAWKSRS